MAALLLLFAAVLVSTAESCCAPYTFEGEELLLTSNINSDYQISITNSTFHVDHNAGQLSVFKFVTSFLDGKLLTLLKVATYYDNNAGYVYHHQNGHCIKMLTKKSFHQCLNPHAMFSGHVHFGADLEKMEAAAYHYHIGHTKVNITLTVKDCLPVLESQYTLHNDLVSLTTLGSGNLRTRIEDPAVFMIPQICLHAPLTHVIVGKRDVEKFPVPFELMTSFASFTY